MHVVTLTPLDALPYRELMLEAYALAADAYTSTVEERCEQPMSWWVDRIAASSGLGQVFGALENDDPVGAVALAYLAGAGKVHMAMELPGAGTAT